MSNMNEQQFLEDNVQDVVIGDCKLMFGDCLVRMKEIPDDSVDLTVTSPPYDNLRTYKSSLEWGESVWKGVIKDLFRTTKQGGVVVWVVGDATAKGSETGTSFRQALYFMECGFNLHDTMIYSKENYIPLTHNRYEQSFEYMFVLSKGRPNTFNPVRVVESIHGGKTIKRTKSMETHAFRGGKEAKPTQEWKRDCNIWSYKIGNGCTTKDRAAYVHPAMFPESLAQDHISSWSNEGDTVLDPFMGAGTTGKMSLLLNRNFIGIEKVEEYFNIAAKRISEA